MLAWFLDKNSNLRPFFGDASDTGPTKDPELWLRALRATNPAAVTTDVAALGANLAGRAKLWFDNLDQHRAYGPGTVDQPAKLIAEDLQDMFGTGPVIFGRVLESERQFRRLHQGTDSVTTYIHEYETALKQLGTLATWSDADQDMYNYYWFVWGLKKPIRDRSLAIYYNFPSRPRQYLDIQQIEGDLAVEERERKRREVNDKHAKSVDESLYTIRRLMDVAKGQMAEAKEFQTATKESLKETQVSLQEIKELLTALLSQGPVHVPGRLEESLKKGDNEKTEDDEAAAYSPAAGAFADSASDSK